MSKSVAKFFPILLIACLIIDAINTFSTGTVSTVMNVLGAASTMIGACSLALLVFYVDLEKNNSDMAKAGFASILLYIVFSVIYMITLKNGSFSVASTMHKLQSTSIHIVHFLQYTTILKLISAPISDPIGSKAQMGAFVMNGVRYLVLIIMVWVTIKIDSPVYKISGLIYDAFVLLVITFVIYQTLEGSSTNEGMIQPQPQQPLGNNGLQQPQQNQQATGFSTTPKFRNPALEQQEAMFAAQNQQQMMQQPMMQQMPQQYSDPMMAQQPMMQPMPAQPVMQPMMQPMPAQSTIQDPDMQYTQQPQQPGM